jgi:hypothetical protein
MRKVTLAALLIAIPALGGASVDCQRFQEAQGLVDEYFRSPKGDGIALRSAIADLLKDPLGSACWLVRSLKPVDSEKFSSEQMSCSEAEPIWAVRGLRYITGCMDFRGSAISSPMADPRDTRWKLLMRRGKSEVPMFATWMSRDMVYLAPNEVQVQIIGRWERWFSEEATKFRFEACETLDDWYP